MGNTLASVGLQLVKSQTEPQPDFDWGFGSNCAAFSTQSNEHVTRRCINIYIQFYTDM